MIFLVVIRDWVGVVMILFLMWFSCGLFVWIIDDDVLIVDRIGVGILMF